MIEQIKKLIFDDDLIEKLADKAMASQGKENTTLPLLKKQYADTQKSIDNMLDAIQQGILTASTKERLESLEKQKSELSVQIVKEEMAKPMLSREQIVFWFHRFRKLDAKKFDHRRRLINSFVNAIFLYDDRITFTFNYKDGSKTITFAEFEKSGLGSDINALAAPKNRQAAHAACRFYSLPTRNRQVSLRLGHAPALTVPRTVIHSRRAAALRVRFRFYQSQGCVGSSPVT